MPVVGLAAEPVGGEAARDLTRIAEQEVGEGVAGAGRCGPAFWVSDPSKLHCPAYCLLSVKSGTQRRNLPPNLTMWRPLTQVRLSLISQTFRSCVFGRWSKAEPFIAV